MKIYIIKIDRNSYLTSGSGDPPRTLVIENAREFDSHNDALQSLAYYSRVNKHRSFEGYKIVTKDVELLRLKQEKESYDKLIKTCDDFVRKVLK